jgi:L-alanine-DL-glutamate epimerase-like enolase superfamily enzyme
MLDASTFNSKAILDSVHLYHGMVSVDRIESHAIEVPFRETPEKHLRRELPHWRYFDVIECELSDGTVGFGETMLFYNWGKTTAKDCQEALGENAAKLLWDDSLGPGLQMALFDALGKSLNVPAYRLLGDKVREEIPISHWCIDMPPSDLLQQAEYAIDRGYTSLKIKGRPWFDIYDQVETLDESLPSSFGVDIDFNETLHSCIKALPVLSELDQYQIVDHFEGPIPQEDVDGMRRLRNELETPLAIHYGRPDPLTVIETKCTDGLVLSGGATEVCDQGAVAASANYPVWIQLVGTGLTTAWTTHLGAVVKSAKWPAITCHEIYSESLLDDPPSVSGGTIHVPTEPGLGIHIDRQVINQLKTRKPTVQPSPRRLIKSTWQGGPVMYFAGEQDVLLNYAQRPGNGMPFYEQNVSTEIIPRDVQGWSDVYERASRNGPVVFKNSGEVPI